MFLIYLDSVICSWDYLVKITRSHYYLITVNKETTKLKLVAIISCSTRVYN